MATKRMVVAGVIAVIASAGFADTFKHRQTGQVLHGFTTQKKSQEQTLVFISEDNAFKPLNLSEYEVTIDKQGRRDNVVVFAVKEPEVMLSKAVAETLADGIVQASNSGPRFIVLAIDSPGGQAEYMKIVASAAASTDNCPVVAYVTGEKYGGAYSAAGVVALSCDRVYMSPHAVLGSVAPVLKASGSGPAEDDLKLFSPDGLAAYGAYAASLAGQKGRPEVLARALIDRSLEVVEVRDAAGNTAIVSKADRQPDQVIVRTLTKVAEAAAGGSRDATSGTAGSAASPAGNVLTLIAEEAVKIKLADKTAASMNDILADMDAAGVQVAYSNNLEVPIRKFTAAKRNVSQTLSAAERLETRANALDKAAQEKEEQIRNQTITQEYRQGTNFSRGGTQRRYTAPFDEYTYRRNGRNDNRSRRRMNESQSITTEIPAMGVDQLYAELSIVLNDLTRTYRQALGLARRNPGVLPYDLPEQALQGRLDATVARIDDVRRRQMTMATTPQYVAPVPTAPVSPLR